MKPVSGMPPHLVVVDPDVAFARTAERWLRHGFPAHHVGSCPRLSARLKPTPHLALIEAAHLEGDLTGALATLKRRWPRTGIVVYAESPMKAALQPVLAANLAGWLVKPLTRSTLVTAVAAVLEGCTVLILRPPNSAAPPSLGPPTPPGPAAPGQGLSQRQAQILDLLALGKTEKEVANLLELSSHTVNHHIERVYRKWRVHNRAEALRRWLIPAS